MEELTEISFRLDSIKDKLKAEFIGLDAIIDQLIQAVIPWCIMHPSQTRPIVVNLWGMTGVGKSSLVKRFLELWNRDENIIHFNMGSKTYFRDMINSMERMYSLNGQPCVIIFDEFQHARTMDQNMREVENPLDRIIWQLMDEGKFNFTNNWHDATDLKELSVGLELCIQRGVKVKNGKVVDGWKMYRDIMSLGEPRFHGADEMEDRDFIPKRDFHLIQEQLKIEFPYGSLLRDYIYQLDGEELVALVKNIEKKSLMSREIDFSKSLIFVIGNLDEAFEMCSLMSADDDPDLIHEESKKITFSTIKEALKDRFRMEEIARLGNIHLIYPALSGGVYREFIDTELQHLSRRFETAFQCSLSFSDAVRDMLYEEGVTATQGFRPLRSSIRYILESSLVEMMQSCYYEYGNHLQVDMERDDLILKHQGSTITGKKLHLPVREAKSKKLNPQYTAITAAHEAGHALVYSILFGRLPSKVSIASSDHFSGGFMETSRSVDFEHLDHLVRDTAVRMAGKKAEELIFGKENCTRGSETDLRTATRRLIFAAREGTIAGFDAAFESELHGGGHLLKENDQIKQWVSNHLAKSAEMAENLLRQNITALKALIELLIERKFLTAESLSEGLWKKNIDVSALLQVYPALVDFDKKLQAFLTD